MPWRNYGSALLTAIVLPAMLVSAPALAGDAAAERMERLERRELRLERLRDQPPTALPQGPRLQTAPTLKNRETAPLDPVSKNRAQRYQSNTRAVIQRLDRNSYRAGPRTTDRLRGARQDLSRFNRRAGRRR